MSSKKKLNFEEFMALHRHWMWANIMREDFESELAKKKVLKHPFPDRIGAYMSLWYGMLFGVLEVVKNKQIDIPGLEDMNSIYKPLKLFRNAVFHAQPKYWSPKLFEIIEHKDSVQKIRQIHGALGEYFLKTLRSRHGNWGGGSGPDNSI